jgi:hypothetical protein
MEKCICILEHRAWDKHIDLNSGKEFSYVKSKIKFNTKTKTHKIVRPGQMGDFSYTIIDDNGNSIYSCGEDWFNKHFSNKSFIREEKLNYVLNNKLS